MSHAPRYVTVMVMCGLVSLLGTVTHAQDWFRQRTYNGVTAPVGPDTKEQGAEHVSPAMRTPIESPVSFRATGLPISIPDNSPAGISSTIAVAAQPNVTAVRVSLEIQHPFRGDLAVTLTSPGGSVYSLNEPSGDSADNIVITDQALGGALSQVQGNWVLKVADLEAVDTGRLLSWSLEVASVGGAYIDLSISLYSNPTGDNNGHTKAAGSEQQDLWERIIEYFADGVYEMTNGAHQIRQVRVFTKGVNFGGADIRWHEFGHPVASGGVMARGGHIDMFETFPQTELEKLNHVGKDMKKDEAGSGYTMAHEWAHYFLGLKDEYDGRCKGTNFVRPVEPSIMSNHWKAKGGNYKWLNFSIKRANPSAPVGDFEDTIFNCQHYAYDASAWEVLARQPSADPRDPEHRQFQTLGPRQFYPELAAAAPAAGTTPRIDLQLPNPLPFPARTALDITWMTDRQDMEIVIDRSGSMTATGAGDATRLAQAIGAAKELVLLATLGKTRIGVTAFDHTVTNVVAQRRVDTPQDRQAIMSAIDGIVAGGGTAIGDAASAALTKLLAAGAADENRVVLLLTDGQNGSGVDPLAVIPRYTAARVPLFTFGFGSGADLATLQQMASLTGGRSFFSETSLEELIPGFHAANSVASSSPDLGSGSLAPSATAPASLRVPLDPSLDRLQLSVVYTGSAPTSAITLTSPTGQQASPAAITTVGTQKLLFFDVGQPGAGNWQLAAAPAAAGTTFTYSISGVQKTVGYDMNIGLRDNGSSVTTPGAVIIDSKLMRHLPISGAAVVATMTAPTGTTTNIQLVDNGVFPDLFARDGTYSGLFVPGGRGSYSLTVRFSNAGLLARETYQGADLSPTESGELVAPPDDVQVPEDFVRSQTYQFSVDTDVTQIPRHDVDGDGKSEMAVFRPSNGTWYVRYSSQNYNPATAGTFQWGLPGDLPISGDFDGDGKIELTVFRPANGTWYLRYSSLGYNVAQAVAFQWGLPGDIPIAGDFDGDGKTELTVFRPSNGTWYVRYSSLGYSAVNYGIFQWGLPGDVPIAGDFDGDGKTELTVYRPVNGVWYFRYSSLAYDFSQAAAFQWGLPGDIPQVGDFDGDGRAELTVYRPSNGTWYIRYSSLLYSFAGALSFQWGLPGDVPVTADFDGDGKTELAVFRPSNGTWYVRYSSLSYDFSRAAAFQWGLPGDASVR